MNLVLSGPIDESLRNEVFAVVRPSSVVTIHARAIRFEDADYSPRSTAVVSLLCKAKRVDHSYVNKSLRLSNFGLLAIDMDSTLITIECIDELADFAGKKKEVVDLTEATMSGALPSFAESLRRRVALLAGLDEHVLRRVYEERLRLTDGAEALIRAVQAAGLYTLLISGGFTYFTERLVSSLSLNAGYANILEVKGNQLTGRLKEPIIGPKEKAEIVKRTMESLGLNRAGALVVGDGANDILMMQVADHSIAYHGKPSVVNVAKHAIEFGSLEVVIDYFASL